LLFASGGVEAAPGTTVIDSGSSVVPQPAAPISPAPATPIVDDGVLTQAEVDFLVAAAINRWSAAGFTAEQLAFVQSVTCTVADLPGWYLGSAGDGVVTLDVNAAGNQWFVDATPLDDAEFVGTGTRLAATAAGGAAGRVDALTTILHELGHQL